MATMLARVHQTTQQNCAKSLVCHGRMGPSLTQAVQSLNKLALAQGHDY